VTLRLTCVNHPASEGPAVRCASCLRPFCRDCVRRRGTFYYCTSCEPAGKVDRPAAVPTVRAGAETTFSAVPSAGPSLPDGTLAVASLVWRAVALVVDVIVVTIAVSVVLGVLQTRDETAQFMIVCTVAVAYEALSILRVGKTPGKVLVGIEVVAADGSPASGLQAWMRGSVKIAQLSCGGATFVAAVLTRERRAIHDLIAGTRVVSRVRRELAT
jgi:uncharacterized RDD family membrane protein YckC